MERRDFLKTAIAAAAPLAAEQVFQSLDPLAAAESQAAQPANPAETVKDGMIYRPLGRTGEKVSVLGVGGAHIGRQREEQESIRIIRTAIDHGITFMDNCWDYNGGQSEIRMGKALRDGYREKVFLMTKIDGRTKQIGRRANRRVVAAAANRPHRPACSSTKSFAWKTPIAFFAAAGGVESAGGRTEGGQDSLHRLYRPQGPAGPPADARHGPAARFPLRRRCRCR